MTGSRLLSTLVALVLHIPATPAGATSNPPTPPASLPPPRPSRPAWNVWMSRPPAWFSSEEARALASAVLAHQTALGDWPKNLDTTVPPSPNLQNSKPPDGTWDNGATVREVRWLARFHRYTTDPAAAAAVRRALEHVLAAQYPAGGWPQRHPPGTGYARHVTFNDGTQIHLMDLLADATAHPDFAWLPVSLRERTGSAVELGVRCILEAQVRIEGRRTVWCAQHDAVTLVPRPARTFEPASLSGAESAGILRFLMRRQRPTPELLDAVQAGVDWFRAKAIHGIKVIDANGDRRVLEDPTAPPVWARFYDLQSGRPVFMGRDGIPRGRLEEIEHERRNGYAWYGTWGEGLDRELAAWRSSR